MLRRVCVTAIVLAIAASDAHAYEFWLRAQTIGQAFQLRQYQLVGPDLFLGRRRYTQTLALRITDIGGLSAYRRQSRLPDTGLTISWHSYLRIDHDFGNFTSGRIKLSESVRRDAIDAIPEIVETSANLDLLYGYVSLDGLFDGALSAQLGRVTIDDGWGSSGVDGATARYTLPVEHVPLSIAATAGLRVREASPLGLSSFELDGTSGAGCQEYVEGPTPGSGSWKLIDRDRMITNHKLSSDYEYCPQREVRQPTVGAAIAMRLRDASAEAGYRRTWSDTVGLIDTADRFTYPDVGLYPNESGQAPSSGLNEERLYVRASWTRKRGRLRYGTYGNLRYSLLHAAFDRADLGIRTELGHHVLEPSVNYFFPTFDGDSIFNVFSIEPTYDYRLAYRYNGLVQMRATGWLRRYAHEDGTSSVAGGGEAGVEHPFGPNLRARLDALYDDGYGGRRAGGTGEIAVRPRRDLWLRGRGAVLAVDREDRSKFVTISTVVSGTMAIGDGVGLHVVAELDHDDIYNLNTRVFAVMDLNFTPEL